MVEKPHIDCYCLYFLKLDGVIKYCGITTTPEKRRKKHACRVEPGRRWSDAVFEIQHRGLSKIDAHLIEGKYIREYNLIEKGWNKINSAARLPGPLNYMVPKHGRVDLRTHPKRSKPIYDGQNQLFS